ncbi:MAG: 8-oxoguanine deaminase [Armatimonadetes bacterium]|nr:8-oxoguanine deaminase [Armatimonadota bacterium]
MSEILIEGCEVVVTMDDAGTEIPGGSILVEDGAITWVGRGGPPAADRAAAVTERIDGLGLVALPGLVNTHHHLYQTLTRVQAIDQGLFGWLRALYPIWAGIDQEWTWAAARVGLAELALSGCATTTDHHYVFPKTSDGLDLLEAEIAAAREIGLRFHPCRGSMDLGASRGGLPPDTIVQDTDDILAQTETAVKTFHDASPGAMLRVAVAPCSPFSVTPRLMRESAALARRLGVRLHTHIAETLDEEAYCLSTHGRRPLDHLDDLGWLGPDVWLAHCVHVHDGGVRRMAEGRTGAAWCPTSNLRLGSGIAPVRALLNAGARVGLGVDGSASNDGGHLLAEARMGMLVSRAGGGASAAGGLSAREALRIATRGGASCLGREDIGSIEAGKRADIALFDVDNLAFAGAEADLVAALVYCTPPRVRHLFVEGRQIVRDSRLVRADEDAIAADGRRVARRILQGSARSLPA